MATTFVVPTYVADPTVSPDKIPAFAIDPTAFSDRIPAYVMDPTLSVGNVKIPAFAVGVALTKGFIPAPLLSLLFFSLTPTGGMLMGGNAVIVGDPFKPTGGMLMGGTAPSSFNAGIQPTGGMKMGGAAVVTSLFVNVYDVSTDDLEPSGGMRMGGSATIKDNIRYIPSGGMAMGGSAIVLEHIPYIVSGGMLMSGTADSSMVTVHAPAGGMLMSGTSPVVVKSVHAPAGGMVMSGTAPSSFNAGIAPTGGMKMGGAAVVTDRQAFYQPRGGMQMGGSAVAYMIPSYLVSTPENPYGDPFPGWSMNMETHAAARYLNLPANSIARFKGRTFVTNAGGLYEMGADNDAGQPIRASIEFPTTDFDNGFEKRMEKAYMGIRTTGKMKLKVMVKGKEPQYYVLMQSLDTVKGTKVPIGKGLVGSYWGMRLDNVDGSDFELGNMEFNPVRGQRHGA